MIIKSDKLVNQACRSWFIYNSCLRACQEQAVSRLSSYVGLQYILDKRKKGKRDRVSYAKVELPHHNSAKGDHIPHEQEYNTRHGVSAIADEVCREIRR